MPTELAEPEESRPATATLLAHAGLGLLLVVAIFAGEGADPRLTLWPTLLGDAGIALRESLFLHLGFGVYILLVAWLMAGFAIACRRNWRQWFGVIFGWSLLLATGCTLADRFANPTAISAAGPGGTIGAGIHSWLAGVLDSIGVDLVLFACLFLGLLAAVDWFVLGCWRLLIATARVCRFIIQAPFVSAANRRRQAIPIHEPEPQVSAEQSEPDPVSKEIPVVHSTSPRKPAPQDRFELPSMKLLEDSEAFPIEKHDEKLRDMAGLLEKTFKDFGLNVKVVGIHTGPVITQYEIALETGLRVTRVTALSDDLALNLKVPSVRIVAPIPGKNTVGIEVPNEHRAVVRLKELILLSGPKIEKSKLPLFLGKDSEGRPLVYDLADMPHLLIAGRTGTGKSVCLNSIILSILLTRSPEDCKLLMIDPKQVELAEYGRLPHLMHPVVTDNSKAEAILSWAVDKMEERYEILRRARVRNIAGYNELSHDEILRRVKPVDDEEAEKTPAKMPLIVIVIDEVGDLMMAMKKEVEGHIIRLAQKSRAAGIHLILTTQRPTVDVITGLIKSNLPARICFQVADRSNSRVVLDEMGAEKLLGKGDMLFLQPNTSTIVRAQGTYASDKEINRIVAHLEVECPDYDAELLNLQKKGDGEGAGSIEAMRKRDDLYEQAIEIVVREGRGSVSLLQRALGIGYGRAARLVDFMAEDGIVGNYNGAQAREVLYTPEQWAEMKGESAGGEYAESA